MNDLTDQEAERLLSQLCKANGIKNVKFNNAYIGFPRKEIEALAARLKRKKGG